MSLAERAPADARSATDARTDAILDRITATFARKGLDGSSMQELAAAAGMSVGNFYRYYPSKVALIAALIGRCACDVRADFERARRAPEPLAAMRAILHDSLLGLSDDETAFWLQVDAAAAIHPEIAAVKREMDESVRANVRLMLGEAFRGACPERLDETTDFMLLFCSSLFRQRAFERGPAFAAKLERLTARLFVMVARELSPGEPTAAAPVPVS